MTRPATLDAWLAYLETLHPKAIALGLDRVRAVHARLGVALSCPVITVTGTNGKGSTCAMLASILHAAGYRAGLYMSPHLVRYNERVRLPDREATDDELVAAFNAVEDARLAAPRCAGPAHAAHVLRVRHAGRAVAVRARRTRCAGARGGAGRTPRCGEHRRRRRRDPHQRGDRPRRLPRRDARRDRPREGRRVSRRPRRDLRRSGPAGRACSRRPPRSARCCCARDATTRSPAKARQWRYRGPRGERFGLPFPALRGAYQLGNAAAVLTALDALHDAACR